jgi:class 3 adenylate cyclase
MGTVAFIDLCGFTRISENENPNTVVSLLNEYFDLMVREIIEEKGSVDKFIGDAVMAVFQGPNHLRENYFEAALPFVTKWKRSLNILKRLISNHRFPLESIPVKWSQEISAPNLSSASTTQ